MWGYYKDTTDGIQNLMLLLVDGLYLHSVMRERELKTSSYYLSLSLHIVTISHTLINLRCSPHCLWFGIVTFPISFAFYLRLYEMQVRIVTAWLWQTHKLQITSYQEVHHVRHNHDRMPPMSYQTNQ